MRYLTIEDVKRDLPDVAVSIARQPRVYCQTMGRKMAFCTVVTPSGPFDFSWQSVTDAINMDRALII